MANFLIKKLKEYIVLQCKGDLDVDSSEEIIALVKPHFEEIVANVDLLGFVFDLRKTAKFDGYFLKQIAVLAQPLKKAQKRVILTNVSKDSLRIVKELGMDSVLEHEANIAGYSAAEQETKRNFKVDVNFINPFVDSTMNTLKVQCSVTVTPQKIYLKDVDDPFSNLNIAIAGVIGLTSKAFNGSIAVCFPKETFLKVLSNMLGETYTDITKDVEDAAGELLNIIFGGAKVVLNDKGYGIEKAIPTIVRGTDLKVRHLSPNPTMVLPFDSSAGPFAIEISVDAVS